MITLTIYTMSALPNKGKFIFPDTGEMDGHVNVGRAPSSRPTITNKLSPGSGFHRTDRFVLLQRRHKLLLKRCCLKLN